MWEKSEKRKEFFFGWKHDDDYDEKFWEETRELPSVDWQTSIDHSHEFETLILVGKKQTNKTETNK